MAGFVRFVSGPMDIREAEMRARRFTYEGQEWEAVYNGHGVGVSSGYPAQVNRWSVTFRCLADPARGDVTGHVSDSKLHALKVEELTRALRGALPRRPA
jgi:hypothetical protein